MENPQIRPGLVAEASRERNAGPAPRIVAFFRNSASGNLAIQLLTAIGIPGDQLGVTPPEQIEHGQGMLLSIGCPDESWFPRVEKICRQNGAEVHRRRR